MAENNLDDLLDTWQEAYDTGHDIPVAELCRDCPEMAAEVERRLRVLRRGARLVGHSSASASAAADLTGSLHGDTAPLPPRLGVYRILGRLGGGGMGEVFRAEEATLGREVAIKIMRPEVAARPGYRDRFLREARTAAAVRHDNVVPIYSVGEEGGTVYIVMPVLEGESLENRLNRGGALPVSEAARVGREAAEGLAAAHIKGLVHRDVKPANLWLEAPKGRVKVLDFGLAREVDANDGLTLAGGVFGSPAYMAPEQANGEAIDHRADLFGLGAVLYRCVTGVPAFQGKSVTAILRAVAEQHPKPPHEVNPAVPPALSLLIMRMLAKNPADRPVSALEVASELAPFCGPAAGGETTATWAPRPPQAEATIPRRRQIQLGCTVVISFCLLIGVVVVTNWPRTPHDPQGADLGQNQPPPNNGKEWVFEPPPGPGRFAISGQQYKGRVDVKLARTRDDPLLRLNVFGALPMRQSDTFRIEAEIEPQAYVYVVWVDPAKDGGLDVTPVYPWNPTADDPWATRPAKEEPVSRLSLPRDTGKRWTAPAARPGVATMVMFARATPLDQPDEVVKKWFTNLPPLPLPPGGETGVVWFDNYEEAKDNTRLRSGGWNEVTAGDEFARWQSQLQKVLQPHAAFQTAVSFARVGMK